MYAQKFDALLGRAMEWSTSPCGLNDKRDAIHFAR
jgi:hypothetical protein